MPRTNPTPGNGNAQKPTSTIGIGFDDYQPPIPSGHPATQQFNLQMDKTLGQLLSEGDDAYELLKGNLQRIRAIKIAQRAREIADLLNPQRQSEEIMLQAERIVESESAGARALGDSIPALRLMGGQ